MTRNRRVTPSEIASCIYDTTGEAIQSLLWMELFFRRQTPLRMSSG
jgi:hypothetical protein